MKTSKCLYCGEIFWTDDERDDICLTCIEQPIRQAEEERTLEWMLKQKLKDQKKKD